MTDYKLVFLSIILSMLVHLLIILNFSLNKKNNEVYVVSLSEYQDFNFSSPESMLKQTQNKNAETIQSKKKKKIQDHKQIDNEEITEDKLEEKKKNLDKDQISLKKIKVEKPPVTKKIEKLEVKKVENKSVQQKEIKELKEKKEAVFESKAQNESFKNVKKNFSLENKSVIVDKLLSEYLTFVSFEINKAASKSYPPQSIKRREQGKIVSILKLDKDGKLLDIKFENKSPKRLFNATIKILKTFDFPTPPKEILNANGHLKIKIPVNFILK